METIPVEKTIEETKEMPEFAYYPEIAGYLADLKNGDYLSIKYEYVNGCVALILREKNGKIEEISRQQVPEYNFEQLWQYYLNVFAKTVRK